MATKKELVQFQIENRTLCGYDLPLFQQNVYSINATKEYLWNITSQNLSCGTGGIIINGISYSLTYTPNLQGLLDALNALGFGFFCYAINEGNTFIYTTDDINIYGNLDLCFTSPTTTTTSTTTTTTTLPAGVFYQYKSNSGSNFFALSIRINGGAWNDLNFGSTANVGQPNYIYFGTLASLGINVGDNVDIAVRDYSGNASIQFGQGYTTSPSTGDWTSKCGKITPYSFVATATTTVLLNINIVSNAFVYCAPTTTTSTTTTTTTQVPNGGIFVQSRYNIASPQINYGFTIAWRKNGGSWNLNLGINYYFGVGMNYYLTFTSATFGWVNGDVIDYYYVWNNLGTPVSIQFGNNATSSPITGDFASKCDITNYRTITWSTTQNFYDNLNVNPSTGLYLPCGVTTTTTTSTSTSTTSTTSTTTTSTTTTTTTFYAIRLGSANCRNNNCNDNAACSVIYNIETVNAPAGAYITLTTDPPPSGASVVISNNSATAGTLTYSEPNGLQSAVFFTLQLRNSGGTILATNSTSLSHQTFWNFLPICPPPPTSTTTSTTTTTTTAAPFIIEIQNQIGVVLNNFTVSLNSINVPALTNISLQLSPNTLGNAISGNPIVGNNQIIITDSITSPVMTVLISDIRDRVTGIPLTFTRTGNGTRTININPITFTAGNIANGILIIVS